MPIKTKVSKTGTQAKKPRKTTEKQPSGGDKKIHKHPKANINGFAQNPQNINKNGRPKKGISAILEKIKVLGYEQPSKQDIEATYLSLLNLTEDELYSITEDQSTPMMAKIIAKDLIKGGAIGTIERLLNRAIGRTKEEVSINGNINSSLNEEDRVMYEKILNLKKKK